MADGNKQMLDLLMLLTENQTNKKYSVFNVTQLAVASVK